MADDIRRCRDLDERLAPYVDREDLPPARQAVEQHLYACPSCGRAVREETAARDLVRGHRDALCVHASDALRARCQASGVRRAASGAWRVRRWVPLSLAATLVLAVAGVFVSGLNDRVQALAASLAIDHVKCFTVSAPSGRADAHASARAWQQDQGWPIVVAQSAPAEQLTLIDVRRCFSADGRAAHLMYAWRGEPLSVYVLQGEAGPGRVVRRLGTQAVIWCANRRTYAVVSSDESRDLSPIVDYLKARVQ